MTVQTRIYHRRDTASNWTSINPTLGAGEIGVETDTLKFKIGNNSQNWNALAYAKAGTADTATTATTATSATNIAGGAAGGVPYQTGSGATSLLAPGTSGQVLASGGAGAPVWTNQSALSVGTATNATKITASSLNRTLFVAPTAPSSGMVAGDLWIQA
jgi:Major tropism determinant N-terminal domain